MTQALKMAIGVPLWLIGWLWHFLFHYPASGVCEAIFRFVDKLLDDEEEENGGDDI